MSMPIGLLLAHINASKLLAGVTSMAFNFGSRALIGELTPAQQRLFQHPVVKRVVVFCMYFIATRDFTTSIALGLATIVALEFLLNEGSRFCVIPGARGHRSATTATPGPLPASVIASMTRPGLPRRELDSREPYGREVHLTQEVSPRMVPLA